MLALVLAALGAGSAGAATPGTPYGALTVKPIGINGGWGERVAAAKYDYIGDGANDVFVASYQDARVYLLSGKQIGNPSKETKPLRIFTDPEQDSSFANYISVPGDVSGDGKPDLAVGDFVGGTDSRGVVYLFNGRASSYTGSTIRSAAPSGATTRVGSGAPAT